MEKRIVYTDQAGAVCVIVPAPNARRDGESDEEFLERIAAKAVPQDPGTPLKVSTKKLPYQIMDEADIPTDRTFRDAWEMNGSDKKIKVHLGRAREVRKRQLLAERDEKLKATEAELAAALDADDKRKEQAVRARRKALRDLDKLDLDGIATVEELKAHRPPELL